MLSALRFLRASHTVTAIQTFIAGARPQRGVPAGIAGRGIALRAHA